MAATPALRGESRVPTTFCPGAVPPETATATVVRMASATAATRMVLIFEVKSGFFMAPQLPARPRPGAAGT